jgi:pimeloyl-ACP methyl ester carboxylesterase
MAESVPRIVLLPGLGGTGELFSPLVREIADQASTQIIAYPPDRVLTYDQLIHFVRAHLPPDEPFAVLAESFSGPIALSIAAAPPDNLRALILCCTFARFPDGPLRSLGRLLPLLPVTRPPVAMLAPFLMGRWRTPELVSNLDRALGRVNPKVLRARARAALAVDVLDSVAASTVPALYLQADQDRIVGKRALREILRRNPAFQAAKLRGPHFLLQCNPSACWAEIVRFLRGSAAAAPSAPLPHNA